MIKETRYTPEFNKLGLKGASIGKTSSLQTNNLLKILRVKNLQNFRIKPGFGLNVN